MVTTWAMIPDHEARRYRQIVHERLCLRRRGRCQSGKGQREQPSGRFQPTTRQRAHQLAGLFQCLPGRRRKSIFACFFFRLVQIVQGIAQVRRILSCRFCILFHDILPSNADTVVRRGTPLHRRQGPNRRQDPQRLACRPGPRSLSAHRAGATVSPRCPAVHPERMFVPPTRWYGRALFRTASGDRWGGRQPLTWLLGDSPCAESRVPPANAGDAGKRVDPGEPCPVRQSGPPSRRRSDDLTGSRDTAAVKRSERPFRPRCRGNRAGAPCLR